MWFEDPEPGSRGRRLLFSVVTHSWSCVGPSVRKTKALRAGVPPWRGLSVRDTLQSPLGNLNPEEGHVGVHSWAVPCSSGHSITPKLRGLFSKRPHLGTSNVSIWRAEGSRREGVGILRQQGGKANMRACRPGGCCGQRSALRLSVKGMWDSEQTDLGPDFFSVIAVLAAGLGQFLNIDIYFSRHRNVQKNTLCSLKERICTTEQYRGIWYILSQFCFLSFLSSPKRFS